VATSTWSGPRIRCLISRHLPNISVAFSTSFKELEV
jgi:hypothetical protein